MLSICMGVDLVVILSEHSKLIPSVHFCSGKCEPIKIHSSKQYSWVKVGCLVCRTCRPRSIVTRIKSKERSLLYLLGFGFYFYGLPDDSPNRFTCRGPGAHRDLYKSRPVMWYVCVSSDGWRVFLNTV